MIVGHGNELIEDLCRSATVGRKAFLTVDSERGGRAAAIYYSLVESYNVDKVNLLTYLTYVRENVRDKSHTLQTPDEFSGSNITQVGWGNH